MADLPVGSGRLKPLNPTLRRNHPLSKGLVFATIFNESGKGTRLWDLSGASNHGSYSGFDDTSFVATPWGPGLKFDGVDDYINLGNRSSLEITPPTTIFALRLKFDPIITSQRIFTTNLADSAYRGIFADINAAGLISSEVGSGAALGPTGRRTLTGTTALTHSVWYDIVTVVNSASTNDQVIYINGVDDGGSYSGTGTAVSYNSGIAAIGYNGDAAGLYFKGTLSHVYVWHKPLLAAAYTKMVQELMDDPYGLFRTPSFFPAFWVGKLSTDIFFTGTANLTTSTALGLLNQTQNFTGTATTTIGASASLSIQTLATPTPPVFDTPVLDAECDWIRVQEELNATPIVPRVIVYKYFTRYVNYVVDSNTVRMPGNASYLFAVNDVVICSTEDFTTEYTLTAVTYSATNGWTTVAMTPALVALTVGGFLGKKYDITDRLLPVRDVSHAIEADTLNLFDSGNISLTGDNSSKFFWDDDEQSGLLYRTSVATTIAAYSILGSSLSMIFPCTNDVYVANAFAGYDLMLLDGADEGNSYPIISNTTNSFTVFTQSSPRILDGDMFLVDKTNALAVKLNIGYKGMLSLT